MENVLIDITRLVHRFAKKRLPTGVDRVSLAYIKHYRENARAVLRHNGGKFVFRYQDSARLFDWILALGVAPLPLLTIYGGLMRGFLRQNVARQFLFNTGHSGLECDDYSRMLKKQGVRPIFMVHDMIPLTHPQYCRAGERDKHFARLRNAVGIASGLIFNSKATQIALHELCAENQWEMPPCAVALLAPELPAAVAAPPRLAAPYFIFVSTIEPRKNHLMILQIWEQLGQDFPGQAPLLVIIGQKGWGFDEVEALLSGSAHLQHLVIEISDCSDIDLVQYLQHAQALLFPSFAEGYGMPVVEALAHGVPVIASDLSVFKEFAADIPEYLPLDDPQQWAGIIMDYAQPDSARRNAQLQRMKKFVTPTWASHFQEVDRLLAELAHH